MTTGIYNRKNERPLYSLNCLYCNKFILTKDKRRKYCNISHAGHISGKIAGVAGTKKQKELKIGFWNPDKKIQIMGGITGGCAAQKILKERKLGFYNPETGRKGAARCKELGISAFFDPKIKAENLKKAHKTCREKGIGMCHDKKLQSKGGIAAAKKNRRQKTGMFFDKKIQSRAGSKAIENRIKNAPYVWKGIGFLSNEERDCAKLLLTKPILGKNCHIKIGSLTYDFNPQKGDKKYIGAFVEYHHFDKKGIEIAIYKRKLTYKQYYNKRRINLDKHGFKDKKLIIIQSLKELE